MSDFMLTSDDPRKLFRRPSRAMKVRQLIYSTCKAIDGAMVLADFVRDHKGEFKSNEIYRAAHVLVTHGILTRDDISWFELVRGKERTRYRVAVKYVEPFSSASRKW